MFTRPDDLTDAAVATSLRQGWGLDVVDLAYAPVGFGSHHWHAIADGARWFVTVDDLDARLRRAGDTRRRAADRLVRALQTALDLRLAGLTFVVAPVPSTRGGVVEPVDDRFVVALYPHVDGHTGSSGRYATRAGRFSVVDRLVEVHAAGGAAHETASADDGTIPRREGLVEALLDTSAPWSSGPFARRTRSLLRRHAEPLWEAMRRYDELVDASGPDRGDWVVTHGEPHRGNVVFTTDGPAIVDWDTALLAPPERDLWSLVLEDPDVADRYVGASGRRLDGDVLRRYRLWWDLCEIALYVVEFRAPHAETADTTTAWRGLATHLDPSRWTDVV